MDLADHADPGREEDDREILEKEVAAPVHRALRHRPGEQKPDQDQQCQQPWRNGNPGPRDEPLTSGVERAEDDELQAGPEHWHVRWLLYPSSTTFSPNSRSTAAISASETSTRRPVLPM